MWMVERPSAGERAILVHVTFEREPESLDELAELARSAGVVPVATVTGTRYTPDAKTFVGKGKLEELQACVSTTEANLVIVNHALTPSQERNLERALSLRVVDRNGLILDIFAQRAQSFEGKLQVELAQLQHLSTRLVRGWTHLERQKGGIGLRGPGETQLETDRRLIGVRIRQIRRRLGKVEKQRYQGRIARKKAVVPTVALVGYTNAGKSTLFNMLTGADVHAADQLFATLDPTLRRMTLSRGLPVILADTVGFIRHLPHELIAAFRSTLLEASEAELLLHVVDASEEDRQTTIEQVNEVVTEIGADHIPQILVYNKIDLNEGTPTGIERNAEGLPTRVWVSAKTGDGLMLLDEAICSYFSADRIRAQFLLHPHQGGIRAKLYEQAIVLQDGPLETGGWDMEVELLKKDLGILAEVKFSKVNSNYIDQYEDFGVNQCLHYSS